MSTFTPEFDNAGYPTDAALDALIQFEGTAAEFFTAAGSLWNTSTPYSATPGPDPLMGRPGTTHTFITGGWSGNESVISAIRATLFWTMFWNRSERGGLYVFHVCDTQAGLRLPPILTREQADGTYAHQDLTDLIGRLRAKADEWDQRAVAHNDSDPNHEPSTEDWYAPAFAAELRTLLGKQRN